MKKISVIALAAVCLAATGRESAFASAFSLARIQTVATDGAYDAARNPALLPLLKTGNAFGLIIQFAPMIMNMNSFDSMQSSSIGAVSRNDRGFLAGGARLSYVRKTGRGSIGLAIDTDDRLQASFRRYDRRYIQYNPSALALSQVVIQGERLAASPQFRFSFGGAVTGNHALGLRISAGYAVTDEVFTAKGETNAVLDQNHRVKTRTEETSAEIAVGYSYTTTGSQAGLLLRSGRFSMVKQRAYFSHARTTGSELFAGSVREPYHFQYARGFSIAGGGYHKLSPFVAVAIEGDYGIPYTYSEKELRCDEISGFYGVTVNYAVAVKGSYAIRAGLEFSPPGPFTIDLGAAISTAREKKRSRNLKQTINTDIYSGHFGVDFTLAPGFTMILGAQLEYLWRRSWLDRTTVESMRIDGLSRLITVQTHLGVSYGF